MSPVHDADPPQPADQATGSGPPAADSGAVAAGEPRPVRRRSPRKRAPIEASADGIQAEAEAQADATPPQREQALPADASDQPSGSGPAEPATEAEGGARKARRNRRRGRKGRGPRDEEGGMA